jgi:hypothetical protein
MYYPYPHAPPTYGAPGFYPPPPWPPVPAQQPQTHTPPTRSSTPSAHPADLSSDGDINPYPSIEEFVAKLKTRHQKKKFDTFLEHCNEREYEFINELGRFTAEMLTQDMALSESAGALVHDEVQRAIRKIKKTRRK